MCFVLTRSSQTRYTLLTDYSHAIFPAISTATF